MRIYRSADGTRWTRLAGTWVQVFTRKQYLTEVWDYRNGDHVAVFGPTQLAGKTRLLMDLLEHTDTETLKIPPTLLVAKPQDKTLTPGLRKLNYRTVKNWPPGNGWFWRSEPEGYAFWPDHQKHLSAKENDEYLAQRFDKPMAQLYWEGNTILVVDELYAFLALYRKQHEINRHLTQGMGMGSGLWFGTQMPKGTQQAGLPGFVFNSPVHLFVARDPVESNRKKFAEIGGVDPRIVMDAAVRMPLYHFLAINRNGPTMAVVQAS